MSQKAEYIVIAIYRISEAREITEVWFYDEYYKAHSRQQKELIEDNIVTCSIYLGTKLG